MRPTAMTKRSPIPVKKYVEQPTGIVSHLAHNWEYCPSVLLSPSEERTMVRDPVSAIPKGVARRLSPLRIWVVPYIQCQPDGDVVREEKPAGGTHTAVWLEQGEVMEILLACRELNAHDTGFELLASTAEIFQSRAGREEMARYRRVIEDELVMAIPGEIDEETIEVKKTFLDAGDEKPKREEYVARSFSATLTEYIHGLWHDVEVRIGPNYLPVSALRCRLELMAELYPPNQGYTVFADNFTRNSDGPKKLTGRSRRNWRVHNR